MNKLTKSAIAAVILASTGAANAALTIDSTTGTNDLFLSVYDPGKARTFNLDLNVTFAQAVSNPAAAFSAVNLASDANWTAFKNGMSASGVQYIVVGGSQVDKNIVLTGLSQFKQTNLETTLILDAPALAMNTHAREINEGLVSGSNSSLINDLPEDPFIGQLNHNGANSNNIWGGFNYNPLANYGAATPFWTGGVKQQDFVDPDFGDVTTRDVFTDELVRQLGTFTLAGDSLSFTPANVTAVPLPAAVWMFGAGLMGVLRMTRRKTA